MEDSKQSTRKSNKKEIIEIFEDPVHGPMEFKCSLLLKIIDTPQFQRLRDIKQLGCSFSVFPGATHTRLAHSLGVCYLAGEFLRLLQKSQPELGIKDKDILCVQIAGLCHDLGRGPFSHVFENDILPKLGIKNKKGDSLKHIDLTLMMFDHLIEENDLMDTFQQHDIKDNDIQTIKDIMEGNIDGCKDARKRFLFEIVVNKRNGIDIGRWDAIARDCHHLGIANNFDHRRCMKLARVILVPERKVEDDKGGRVTIPEELQLCFRNKEADNLYEMFRGQYMVQRKAVKHKVTSVMEHMIMQALVKADKHVKIFPAKDKDGTMLTMSEALEQQDMHAFTFMTDSVIDQVLSSSEVDLDVHVAKEILKRVRARDVYTNVGEVLIPPGARLRSQDEIAEKISKAEMGLPAEDVAARVVVLNYGQKEKNPMDSVWFYSKHRPDDALVLAEDEVSGIIPKKFQERYVRLYCRKPEQAPKATERFKDWCKKKNFPKIREALDKVQSYLGI
ncbi:deoxynucleoside triphosphate triphosphohydrolase SAMHD1-like [Lytechinus variegatus]|uniref:deoxynucleoside triphosphate triphosphohydrolase SAMHD1-like n=1 Tax=Lytechinus variegatus TaxID=7654 RepID=UPI001BB1C4F6|nr:deoxynucleoside triphosphate triphosphohydrolase SAMHD1-like [Lytechinus variegatus]